MGYGIGLAGLASTAEAIDVTSNNIANAQTVGYKSGEYVLPTRTSRLLMLRQKIGLVWDHLDSQYDALLPMETS